MRSHRFSYTPVPGFPDGMPFVEMKIFHNNRMAPVLALVDSGSALNVLPFDVGKALGFKWAKQTYSLDVGGVLKDAKAYAVLVQGEIASFPSKDLAFAWVDKPSRDIPILLGQVNFFQVFDVYFYGKQQSFDVVLNDL